MQNEISYYLGQTLRAKASSAPGCGTWVKGEKVTVTQVGGGLIEVTRANQEAHRFSFDRMTVLFK